MMAKIHHRDLDWSNKNWQPTARSDAVLERVRDADCHGAMSRRRPSFVPDARIYQAVRPSGVFHG